MGAAMGEGGGEGEGAAMWGAGGMERLRSQVCWVEVCVWVFLEVCVLLGNSRGSWIICVEEH